MLRLTDQEKLEIIHYLKANKPLPDKYRFLFFGDKHKVVKFVDILCKDTMTIVEASV